MTLVLILLSLSILLILFIISIKLSTKYDQDKLGIDDLINHKDGKCPKIKIKRKK